MRLHDITGLAAPNHCLDLVDALVQVDIDRDHVPSEVRKVHRADHLALDEAMHGADVDLQRCCDLAVQGQLVVWPVPLQFAVGPISELGRIRLATEGNNLPKKIADRCATV